MLNPPSSSRSSRTSPIPAAPVPTASPDRCPSSRSQAPSGLVDIPLVGMAAGDFDSLDWDAPRLPSHSPDWDPRSATTASGSART